MVVSISLESLTTKPGQIQYNSVNYEHIIISVNPQCIHAIYYLGLIPNKYSQASDTGPSEIGTLSIPVHAYHSIPQYTTVYLSTP